MMFRILSCAGWSLVYLLCKHTYLDPFPIFQLGYLDFYCWDVRVLYIFRILHPYYIWFTNTFSRRSRCWSRGMWSSHTSTNTSKYIYMWNNSQEYLLKACRRSHATKAVRKIPTCLGRTMGKREKTNTFSHSVCFFFFFYFLGSVHWHAWAFNFDDSGNLLNSKCFIGYFLLLSLPHFCRMI